MYHCYLLQLYVSEMYFEVLGKRTADSWWLGHWDSKGRLTSKAAHPGSFQRGKAANQCLGRV